MTHHRIVVGIDATHPSGRGATLDGSEPDVAVLRWAVHEAHRRGATLVVATALAGPGTGTDPANPGRTAALADLLSHQRTRIDAACVALPPGARPVICQEVIPGDPVTVLAHLAREADLLVVGADRHGGLGVSSVAGRLAGRLRHPGALGGRCVLVAGPVPAPEPQCPCRSPSSRVASTAA